MYPYLALLIFFCMELLDKTASWIQNSEPRMLHTYNVDQLKRFSGNDSYVDYFKLLVYDQSSILVGSRNVVFNLSLPNLTENKRKRIEWPPTGAHRELCYLKGKSEEDCHNYIRVGSFINDTTLLICGTNAYKPLCREINLQEALHEKKEFEGRGRCPYDPNHNSSYIFSDGHLYSATVADFSGGDPLIYRDPLRTEKSNLKQLNEPDFVSTITHGDYVLFFFRESAVEYINCGKVVYSRVARVCKRDKGGPHLFFDRWTSFIKARLNCSVSGDYPFYFNEIQSTSQVIEGVYGDRHMKVIYGVFTTPSNSIGGSAICVFSIDDIMKTFNGPFKGQEDMNSNWLRVQPSKVPTPRPGKCVNDSRTLPDLSVNFAKRHSLMDESVPSLGEALLIRVSLKNRFTAIAIDPQVKTISGEPMDVIFIGTDDGHILKGVHRVGGKPAALLIEDINVTNAKSAIKSLSILRLPYEEPKLLIVTDEFVQTMPLYRCASISTCRDCVRIQDPYCAWDNQDKACVAHEQNSFMKKNLLQNVAQGSHVSCQHTGRIEAVADHPLEMDTGKDDIGDSDMRSCPKCFCNHNPCTNDQSVVGAQEKIVIYTADTLGMVVATSVLATLVVGFVAGYFCSRHFRPDTAYSNMPLHSHPLNRLSESNIHGESASYLSSCANNKAAINLVVNVPPKNANDKNANASPDNNKTLQKIKKTYI